MRLVKTAPARSKSDLGIRTVTGIGLILVALFCLIYGQTPFWLLLCGAGLAMMTEWSGLVGAPRWQGWLALLFLAVPLLFEEPHLDIPVAWSWYAMLGAAVAVAVITRNLRLASGILYVGLPTLSLFYIHDVYDGIDLSLWTLATVWATDIGAYFAGRSIGGPKLAPVLSPNKTWAGLIGGVAAAIAIGFLLAHWLHVPRKLPAFSGILAVAAQAGDLYESMMKRKAGVKDSGHILPGHGGAMDRLDGVVPAASLVMLLLVSGLV